MRLLWISFKMLNEVMGFVRPKVRMITENQQSEKSYPHFHNYFQAGNQRFLRRCHLIASKESSIFNGFRVSQSPID